MASEATKSIGGGLFLSACPRAEREPRMHWMEERRRLNDSLHLSQEMVVLYFWSHFSDSMEASLLRQTFVALPVPPVRDITSGVNELCSTSRILCSYVRILHCSCFLYVAARVGWRVEGA